MIHIKAEFTAMVTGHGLNRSHLHRFKFIPNSTCVVWTKIRTDN